MTSISNRSAITKRPKQMRWLSPLLLVSLGLHGLGLVIPIPREAEVLNEPEELTLDPIPVSMLPAVPLPNLSVDEPVPSPAPVPPPAPILPEPIPPEPAPEIYPIVEPPIVEAPVVEAPPPTPELAESIDQTHTTLEPEESAQPFESTEAIESNKPDKPSLEPQELRPEGTRSGYTANLIEFSNTAADVGAVFDQIGGEVYELDYLQSLCFPDEERVTGSVGVVFDSTSRLHAAKIIQSTRIDAVDTALEEWFSALKEGENSTAQIESVFDPTLYEWTDENGQAPVETEDDSSYKAYTLSIDVNLIDNC